MRKRFEQYFCLLGAHHFRQGLLAGFTYALHASEMLYQLFLSLWTDTLDFIEF